MFPILPPILPIEEPNPAPAWVAADATYSVTLDAEREEARLTMRYRFEPLNRGWYLATLAGPGLVATKVSGPVSSDSRGAYVVIGPGSAPVVVVIEGTVAAPGGSLQLPVLPALRQRVEVDAPGLEVEMPGMVDHHLTRAESLVMQFVPERTGPPPVQPPLTRTRAAHAFFEEGGELLIHSALQFEVVRGAEDEFRFSAAGLEEVQVVGEHLARWERRGSEVILTPNGPVKGVFKVEVDARAPIPAGAFTVPVPVPVGALSGERIYSLGASESVELVHARGRTIAARQAPVWARGLMERPAVVWWQGEAPALRSERYQPQLGPDTVIERAEVLVVASLDGTTLLRSTFYVRNERRQYLHLLPMPGFEVVTARRGSRAIPVLSDGQGGVYIALERSVETVRGPVAMPVEVSWIARLEPFEERKGSYAIQIPAVDAPIQAIQWEIHLPRGYLPGKKEGEDQGGPVYRPAREQAQDALYNALDAWRSNDLDQARYWTDRAAQLSPDDENAVRLDANIDLLLGNTLTTSNNSGDDAAARRIRSIQAAKNEAVEDAQAMAERKAAEALALGDLDEAERQYNQVISSAVILQRTEQSGSEEQRARYSSASSALSQVQAKREEAKKASQPVITADPGSSKAGGRRQDVVVEATEPEPEEEMLYFMPPEPPRVVIESQSIVIYEDGELPSGDEALDSGVLSALSGDTERGLSGLIEGEIGGEAFGLGGLGVSGTGMGGGGTAEGIGGIGTLGTGSSAGYGAGRGDALKDGKEAGGTYGMPALAVMGGADVEDATIAEEVIEDEAYVLDGVEGGVVDMPASGATVEERVMQSVQTSATTRNDRATRATGRAASPSPPPPPPPPPPMPAATTAPAPMPAPAQPVAAPKPTPSNGLVQYKQRTEIDFEGLDVSGELVEPAGALIMEQRAATMSPLIDANGTPAPPEAPVALDALGYLDDMPMPAEPPLPEEANAEISPEYLSRVPSGRSYQDVVENVPGVAGGKGKQKAEEKARDKDTEADDDYRGEDAPYESTSEARRPSPPSQDRGRPAEKRDASRGPLRQQKYTEEEKPDPARTRMRAPEVPNPVEGRTVEFAQKPTPFTLALPLDGAAMYRTAGLLGAAEAPTITFTYRVDKEQEKP